jgi:branched-chain amino acid transport system ATP-binding protein
MTAPLLEVQQLCAGYGSLRIVWDASLEVREAEWVVLVGASGSGKTTLLRTIAGLLPVQAGQVHFAGRDITGVPAHQRIRAGLALAPEGRRLFSGMTVAENLMLGGFAEDDARVRAERLAQVYELFPILARRKNQIAATMSGGEQQMCAIGRALMMLPRLLIIDELSMGLAPVIVERIMATLVTINTSGTALLVIDQDIGIGLGVAQRAYVMRSGRIVMEGEAETVLRDPALERQYIGA